MAKKRTTQAEEVTEPLPTPATTSSSDIIVSDANPSDEQSTGTGFVSPPSTRLAIACNSKYEAPNLENRLTLRADLKRDFLYLRPGQVATVPTGVHCRVPAGYEIDVLGTNTMAHDGLLILNPSVHLHTTDIAEIFVIINNLSNHERTIVNGDVIGRMRLVPVYTGMIDNVKSVSELHPISL